MVIEKVPTKEEISVQEFGDLSTGCSAYAAAVGSAAFFVGGLAANVALRYARPMVLTRELRFLATLISGVTFSIWAAKRARLSCERDIDDNYKVLRPVY